MAVTIILVAIAALAFPNFGILGRQAALDDAQELAALLEFTRQRAVGSAAPHQLVIDIDANAFWVEREVALPLGGDDAKDAGGPPRWSELRDLPLSAPHGGTRSFVPLADAFGRASPLRDGVRFEAVETPAGVVATGAVVIPFSPDGSAEPTDVALLDEEGHRILLSVEPLADVVTIQRVD